MVMEHQHRLPRGCRVSLEMDVVLVRHTALGVPTGAGAVLDANLSQYVTATIIKAFKGTSVIGTLNNAMLHSPYIHISSILREVKKPSDPVICLG